MGLAQIKMPQLGESVTEGTVDKWLKREGDQVKRDEPIVEVVTDKVNAEIPSPFEGKLVKITAAEGEVVKVGAVIAQIEVAGAGTSASAPEAPTTSSAPAAAPTRTAAPAKAAEAPTALPAAAPAAGDEHARLSPAVRKLAAEHGIDATSLRGSGMGGRVTRDDVLAAVTTGGAAAQHPPLAPEPAHVDGAREELVKLSVMRRSIAEHMVRSLATSPHAWTLQEIDVTNLVRYRESEKEGFRARHGVALTYLPFVVQVLVRGLRQFPWLNSTWSDEGVILKRYINLGHRGLHPRRADRAGAQGRRPARLHRPGPPAERPDRAGAQQAAQARGRTGRHVHLEQHWGDGLDREPADHQPAAGRDPHDRVDRQAAGGDRRRHRRAPHDEHVPELRPPDHRRHDGRAVPHLHETGPRGMDRRQHQAVSETAPLVTRTDPAVDPHAGQ